MKDERTRLSQRQEQRVAKQRGGYVNPGSGSGWKRKNDVRTPGITWEMKRTGKTQITIKAKDIEALRSQAVIDGRIPLMHIEIGNRRAVLILEEDFDPDMLVR